MIILKDTGKEPGLKGHALPKQQCNITKIFEKFWAYFRWYPVSRVPPSDPPYFNWGNLFHEATRNLDGIEDVAYN